MTNESLSETTGSIILPSTAVIIIKHFSASSDFTRTVGCNHKVEFSFQNVVPLPYRFFSSRRRTHTYTNKTMHEYLLCRRDREKKKLDAHWSASNRGWRQWGSANRQPKNVFHRMKLVRSRSISVWLFQFANLFSVFVRRTRSFVRNFWLYV